MNSEKRLPVFLGISAVFIISSLLYVDFTTERIYEDDPRFYSDNPNAIPDRIFLSKSVDKIIVTKTIDIDREKIFKIMADVKNYPHVLPKNIISTTILEQNDSSIVAEEEIIEIGIKVKLLVKHTIIPYEKQIIEILDGDAKGTKIIATFEDVENSTKITTDVDFKLHGLLSPFKFLAKGNIESAMNTIILAFADYAKGFEKESQKVVDDLYREILSRSADPEALVRFSTLIENGEISAEDLRQMLLDSQEFKIGLMPNEVKNLDELSEESKKIVDDVYHELLMRPADAFGLQYFGSMIEANKITKEDLRQITAKSTEFHWLHKKVQVVDLSVQDGLPIVLTWNKPNVSMQITDYKIYRDKITLATVDGDTNSFTDYSVVEGNSYTYIVAVISGNVEFGKIERHLGEESVCPCWDLPVVIGYAGTRGE